MPNMLRLLIVDDTALPALSAWLRTCPEAPPTVDTVATLAAGRSALQAARYDLVLLGDVIAGLPSLGFIADARSAGSSTPVIVVTLAQEPAEWDAILAAGAADYLCRERLDADGLARSIRYTLAQHSVAERLHQCEQVGELLKGLVTEALGCFELAVPCATSLPVDAQIAHLYAHLRLTDCNAVLAQMYGCETTAELLGARLERFMPRANPLSATFLRRFIESGYQLLDVPTPMADRDGQPQHVVTTVVGHVASGSLRSVYGTRRDVTAEHVAAQTRADLAAIAASPTVGIVGLDAAGAVRSWSAGAQLMYGYSAGEVLGRPGSSLFVPQGDRLPTELVGLGADAPITDHVLLAVRQDGSTTDIALTVIPLADRWAASGGAVCLIRDISAQTAAERALTNSRRQFDDVLHYSRDALYKIDLRRNAYVYVSPSFEALLGYSFAELKQEGFGLAQTVIHPDDLERVAAAFSALLAGDDAANGMVDYRLQTVDRSWRWISASQRIIRDQNGLPIYVVGSLRDITESKAVVEALRTSEQRFRHIVEATQEGVFVNEFPSTITYINQRGADILGYTVDELVGSSLFALLPPAAVDVARQQITERQAARTAHYDLPLLHKAGHLVWCHFSVTPMVDADGNVTGSFGMVLDITERKRTEQALRDSTERLERAQRIAHMGSFEWDMRANQVRFSDELRSIFGLDPQTTVFDPITLKNMTHPDDQAAVEQIYGAVLRGAETPTLEYRIVRPDGEVRYINGQIQLGAPGSPGGHVVTGTALDITGRKRAEEALRESESRLRRAQRTARMGSWEYDLVAKTAVWSDEMYRIVGLPSDTTLTSATLRRCIHPESIAEADALLAQLARGMPAGGDLQLLQPDGTVRFVNIQGETTSDAAGVSQKLSGTMLDITERKQIEDALRDSQERLAVALHSAGIGLWEWFVQENATNYSPFWKSQLGYAEHEIVNVTSEWESRVHPDDLAATWAHIGRQIAGHGTAFDTDHRLRHKDGTYRWIMSRGTIFRGADGAPLRVLATNIDITDRKHAEEALLRTADKLQRASDSLELRVAERTGQLKEAKEEAERANAAKSEFLSRMSHELRTPMNSILGFAQIMEMEGLGGKQSDRLAFIMKAGRHLLQLINEVLDMARVEAGHLAVSPEPVPVFNTIQNGIDMIRPLARQRNLRLSSEVATAERYVQADQQRLAQVLLNLLSNAAKYNRDDGAIDVTVTTGAAGTLRMTVSDTGAGIAAEHLGKLFVPFERLNASDGVIEGTGLGLALSRRLVELMGGTMGVDTTPGVGSRFWFELREVSAPLAALDSAPPAAVLASANGQLPQTVLYIEDNLANVQVIEHVLEKHPHIKLLTAMQGQMGLDLVREHRPALVLLDLHLPDLSGEEVLRRLRASDDTRDVPVVILSADAAPGQMRKLLAAGADDYLAKPFDMRQFLAVVNELLTRPKPQPIR